MKIFINAGHGGSDPGAVSKNGNKEKDITYKIAALTNKFLLKMGYETEFYQQKKSVTEITQKENISNSDLFISIHCNSFTSSTANGVEVLYFPTSIKGRQAALIMQKSLLKNTLLNDRGIKARDNIHVLKHTKAPAILIELAFLSNSYEEQLLINNKKIFVKGILDGIENIKNLLA